MHKIYFFIFLLFSITYSKQFNFNEVLDLALKNNKDLKKQKYNIDSSEFSIKSVEASSYGKLSLSEEISNTNHSGYVFNSKLSSREASFKDFGFSQMNEGINTQPKDLNKPNSRNNFNTKLSYDIPIFTGFKLSKQKEILFLQKKANKLKLKLNEKELSFELLKAYNGAVVAKDLIKAIKKAKKVMSFLVKSANAFHKEGLVTKIDVKQAKVHLLNVNSQLIEAKNKFNLSLAYLNFLCATENIDDVQSLQNFNFITKNYEKLYDEAIKNRYEIKLQDINNKVMKKNIDIVYSQYYPKIYSHLEYGFNDDKLTLNSNKDYYLGMIGINYTLFDESRKTKKERSKIEYKKSILEYEKLKDLLKFQIKKTLLNLNSKNKILKEKKEAKILANDIFEQSKLMYKNHLISMANLLEQEANLRKNDTQFLMAKYDKSLAIANLILALGKNLKGLKNDKNIIYKHNN